jgi:hypothetical protein
LHHHEARFRNQALNAVILFDDLVIVHLDCVRVNDAGLLKDAVAASRLAPPCCELSAVDIAVAIAVHVLHCGIQLLGG